MTPGYETYIVEPHSGGLDWFEGTVPIGAGDVEVCMDAVKIRVRSTHGLGILKYKQNGQNAETPVPGDGNWIEVNIG